MLPVLEFIFQDFWHFMGAVILLSLIGQVLLAFFAVIGRKL